MKFGLVGQAVVILLLSALAGGISYFAHPKAPAFYLNNEPLLEGETKIGTVLEEWGGNVLWIDARQKKHFDKGHVAGAIMLNEADWSELLWEHIESLQMSEKPIVVYCGSQACQASKKVAERMRAEIGLENVYVLRDGWRSLKKAGLVE